MRNPLRRIRNEGQPGGVGPTAEAPHSPASGRPRIPDGYPSLLVMQRHPETGKPGSYVFVQPADATRARRGERDVAEIDPSTGEFLTKSA